MISDHTRNAMGRAFANLDGDMTDHPPISGGTLEAVFMRAIQDAFIPTLQDWVEDHNKDIMEQLKPMIRAWMDEHLPPIIEAAVAKELGRLGPSRLRRR